MASYVAQSMPHLLPGQQNIRNNTGRDRREHIIAVHTDPLIPARRRLQSVLMPVVHDVIMIAILCRKPFALVPVVMWNGTARAATGCLMHRSTTAAMRRCVPRIAPSVRRLTATVIIIVLLRESGARSAK